MANNRANNVARNTVTVLQIAIKKKKYTYTVLTPGRGMDSGVRASGVRATKVSINARYDIVVTFYWCQQARKSKPKCNHLTFQAVLDPLATSQGNGIP